MQKAPNSSIRLSFKGVGCLFDTQCLLTLTRCCCCCQSYYYCYYLLVLLPLPLPPRLRRRLRLLLLLLLLLLQQQQLLLLLPLLLVLLHHHHHYHYYRHHYHNPINSSHDGKTGASANTTTATDISAQKALDLVRNSMVKMTTQVSSTSQ